MNDFLNFLLYNLFRYPNKEGKLFMKLLNQIFPILFYILFFYWTFLKIRNIVFIKKFNYKDFQKNIKQNLKNQKFPKNLYRIIIISVLIAIIYLAIGLASVFLAFSMMFFTLGGTAYVDTGTDSTFYNNLISFVGSYFSFFKYIFYYIYITVYMILIRNIYINILVYKKLKNNDIYS